MISIGIHSLHWNSSPLHPCVLDHVYHSANIHKSTILVSLDFRAALDTIDHRILSNHLESTYRISGTALQWITSFHMNHSQYVKLGDSSSNHKIFESRVPQGSVLGPLLFIILCLSNCFSLLPSGCWSAPICWWHSTPHLYLSILSVRWSPCARICSRYPISLILFQLPSHKPRYIRCHPSRHSLTQTTSSNISHINVAGSTVPLSETVKSSASLKKSSRNPLIAHHWHL